MRASAGRWASRRPDAEVTTPPLVVATRNAGKAAELGELVRSLGWRACTLDDAGVPVSAAEDDIEAFDTFEANAIAKARYYHRASGGLPAIADDSGLEVAALGGAPGVLSRRWAGADGPPAAVDAANNAALLAALNETEDRHARFTCVLAFVDEVGEVVVRGVLDGRIAHTPRGHNGFGYDPLFEPHELDGRTLGEASEVEKRSVSHRARAAAALAPVLASRVGAAQVVGPDADSR